MKALLERIPTSVPVALALATVILLQCVSDFTYLADEVYYLSHPFSERNAMRVAAYLLGYSLAIAAVFSVAFASGIVAPVCLSILLVSTYALDLSYQLLGSRTGFDINEYELARDAAGMAAHVVIYANIIWKAVVLSLLLVGLLLVLRAKVPPARRSYIVVLVPLAAIALVTVLSLKVFSIKPFAFPALVKIPAVAAYYEAELSENSLYARAFDGSLAVTRSPYKDIVWIIDESVRGDYLGINGYPRDTTPYLSSIIGQRDVVNFGVTSSTGSHSALANLSLRIGLQPKHQQTFDVSRFTLPTIYQYAKHAGYTTTLIDLQMSNGELQNYLTAKDLRDLDDYITAERGMDVYERDRHAIEIVRRKLARPERNFLVLVKWGTHWPYQYTYPKSEEVFKPTLKTVIGSMTMEHKAEVVNTYLNSVRYGADGFLRMLMSTMPLDGRMVFYTSDHGQALLEDGNLRSHGDASSLANGQGSVPLLIFSKGAKDLFPDVRPHHYSAFQIFNTTLLLLGYAQKHAETYGPTLFAVPGKEFRSFYVTGTGKMQEYRYDAARVP